ncbi:hypothetical protein F9K79_01480 [Ochrobactrum sp. Kaboul]|nr:hypothetical protein F9K79_01480 [Ochrobactrum sp. Kaboul]
MRRRGFVLYTVRPRLRLCRQPARGTRSQTIRYSARPFSKTASQLSRPCAIRAAYIGLFWHFSSISGANSGQTALKCLIIMPCDAREPHQ